jgi:hypothetical protein
MRMCANVPGGQCRTCGAAIMITSGRRYCSQKCFAEYRAKSGGSPGLAHGYGSLSTATVGAIHELIVATDLMKSFNMFVFRALDPGSPCDFLVHDRQSGQNFRLEVTTGRPDVQGEIRPTAAKIASIGDKCDVLAVVHHSGKIRYYDPGGLLRQRASLSVARQDGPG